jgi:protein TonB
MNDSAARAPRFDKDSSPAPAFLWAPPQKPVSVSIPLAIIDRLEKEAVENFRSLTSRGSEIGGLLFGGSSPGAPLAVTVESYEPFECEYGRGPLFRLTEGELARIGRIIEERRAAGVQAIGFYRSHTRKALGLDGDDLALFDSKFAEPHHIALLIRPNATKPSVGAIFIREDGKVQAEASCLEFPFRSSQHDAKADQGLYDGAVAGPRSVAAAPAAAKPAPRAQIVPIASRRELTPETPLPAPVPAPVAAPPEVPAPVAASPEPPKPAPEPPVAAKEPEPVREPKPAPAAAAEAEREAAPKKSGKMLWILVGTAASLALAGGFVFTSGVLHRGNPAATLPGQDTSALALRVERNGGDIVLTWNRDSAAIKVATKAMLSISDGPQQENVAMDMAQLRNGSIVYSPVTSDVVFKMEVTGADQLKTTSESVRVLRTRPSPMEEPATQQAKSPVPAPAAPKAEAQTSAAEPEPQEEKVTLAQAVKPFQKANLADRLRPATNSELPDAPALGAPAPAAASVNLGSLVGTQAAPLPQTPAAPSDAKPASGGKVQQAQLIRRKDPEYPKLARDSGASGVVELIATIAVDGHVREVRVLRGHPLLRQVAAEAVKTWQYRPATLNGAAVESQTQVLLNFKSEK